MRNIGVSVKPPAVVIDGPDEHGNATVNMAYDYAENGELWDFDYLVFPQPREPGLAEKVATDFEGYKQIGLDYEAEQECKRKEESDYRTQAESAASIAFVAMAQNGQLDDVTISEHQALFAPWASAVGYAIGSIITCLGVLYKCAQAHTSQDDWAPEITPALWQRIGDPGEEWPEWTQPIGAHDAYSMGAKVSHAGKHWVSDVAANTWEPGVYGWTEK